MIAIETFKDSGILVAAYLIGAINFCYMLSKIISGKKLTEIGDKNPGGWNMVFNISKIWGAVGIILDVGKSYIVYILAYSLSSQLNIIFIGTTHSQFIAMLSGVAAVLGHNYSPYLRFKGGKGIAALFGFLTAIHPLTIPVIAIGMLIGLLFAKNMIWAVGLGIIFPSIFLMIYKNSIMYLLMAVLLIVVMIPKQINRSIPLSANFKFRKEKTLGDLFKPKIR